jgi:hypothetical protein
MANDEKSRIRIFNAVHGSRDPDLNPSQNVTDPAHCPFFNNFMCQKFDFLAGIRDALKRTKDSACRRSSDTRHSFVYRSKAEM